MDGGSVKFFLCAHQAKKKLEHCAILPVQLIMNGLDLIVMKNASQTGLIMDYFVGLMVSFHNIIKCLSKFPLLTSLLFYQNMDVGQDIPGNGVTVLTPLPGIME
jgi:hypothetical protein